MGLKNLELNHWLASFALFLRSWPNIFVNRQEIDQVSLSELVRSWIVESLQRPIELLFSNNSGSNKTEEFVAHCEIRPCAISHVEVDRHSICACHRLPLQTPSVQQIRCNATGKLLDTSEVREGMFLGDQVIGLNESSPITTPKHQPLKFYVLSRVPTNQVK